MVLYYILVGCPWNYRMPITAFCVNLQAGFNNPWSVNSSTMDMTSQCSKLKWNQEPRFHCKVLNILTSFTLKFLGKSRAREREKQIAPSWRYFYGLQTKLTNNPRARIRDTLPDGWKWDLKCASVVKNDPIMGLFKLINDGVQKRFDEEQETYQDDKKNRPYIILFGNLLSLSCSSRFLASKHGVFVPSGQIQNPESKGPLFWQWTLSRGLTLFVCSVPVEAQDQCPCILGILLLYLYQEKDEIT